MQKKSPISLPNSSLAHRYNVYLESDKFRDLLNGIRHIKKTIHTTWFSKPNFSMQATQTQMSAQDTAFADMHICQTNDSSSLVAGSTSPL